MLELEFELAINEENGEAIAFVDTTANYGINGNIDYSDVKAVRFLFQNYLAVSDVQTLSQGEVLEQYHEYIKTLGSATIYDNKLLGSGAIFIPFVNAAINSGDQWETLGIYSPLITSYLPTAFRVPFETTTEDWGIDGPIFPDTVYGLQYEIYIDTTPGTLTNVTNEKQYIVVGTGTCVYAGNTYREGEVFIASDNGAVSFTGSANLKILEASRQKFYIFMWELKKRFYGLVAEILGCCGDNIYLLRDLQLEIDSLDWSNLSQRISMSKSQKTINWINEKVTQLENQ